MNFSQKLCRVFETLLAGPHCKSRTCPFNKSPHVSCFSEEEKDCFRFEAFWTCKIPTHSSTVQCFLNFKMLKESEPCCFFPKEKSIECITQDDEGTMKCSEEKLGKRYVDFASALAILSKAGNDIGHPNAKTPFPKDANEKFKSLCLSEELWKQSLVDVSPPSNFNELVFSERKYCRVTGVKIEEILVVTPIIKCETDTPLGTINTIVLRCDISELFVQHLWSIVTFPSGQFIALGKKMIACESYAQLNKQPIAILNVDQDAIHEHFRLFCKKENMIVTLIDVF